MSRIIFFFLLLSSAIVSKAALIKGTVSDKQNNEVLIGATIMVDGTTTGAITDIDGKFELAGLRNGVHKLIVSYISYKTITMDVEVNGVSNIDIKMEPNSEQLGEIVVTAAAKKNTETAIIAQQRNSLVMQTGISAQQIARTQDKDASEVIK